MQNWKQTLVIVGGQRKQWFKSSWGSFRQGLYFVSVKRSSSTNYKLFFNSLK